MEIATRTLTLRDGDDTIEIPIHIFAPQQQEPQAWSCRYEIEWPEGKKVRDIWGHDSLQAILFALQAIGTDIYTSEYHKAGDLSSGDSWKGYGFPVPRNLRDLLIGDDEKYL